MSAAAIEGVALPTKSEFDGFVGQDRTQARENPHAFRHAYMPGVYYAKSEARVTGYTFFPQGKLITFRTFPVGGHMNPTHMEDAKAPNSRIIEITAEQALQNAAIEYPVFESIDHGFVGLPALMGNDRAQDYFDLLHPSFFDMGYNCPSGLAVCPTCRSQWLESEASKTYFNERKKFDADVNVALEVKQLLYDSNSRFVKYCTQSWRELVDTYERTRNNGTPFVLDDSHHHTRRCIHAPTFEDRELGRIQAMASSNAAAIGEAVKGGGVNTNDFTDEELAEIYAKRAARAKAAQSKAPSVIPVSGSSDLVITSPSEMDFAIDQPVLCDGEPATIKELKPAGWFLVELASGETKSVRKDKLETIKENTDEREETIQPKAE